MAAKAKAKGKLKKPTKKGFFAGIWAAFGGGKKKTAPKRSGTKTKSKTRPVRTQPPPAPAAAADPQWEAQPQWDAGQPQWDPQAQPAQEGWEPEHQGMAEPFSEFDAAAEGGYAANYPAAAPAADAGERALLFPEGVDDSIDSLFESFEVSGAAAPPPQPITPPVAMAPEPASPPLESPDAPVARQASYAPDLSAVLNKAFVDLGVTPEQLATTPPLPDFGAADFPDFGAITDFSAPPLDEPLLQEPSFNPDVPPPPPPPPPPPVA
ncbi:MAG: hypothetical protein KGR26_01055, partial [Cyanobacteria bacterium REEB65]|nr:hypothetical protein [Cyanobacteria bacterium REEB65]